MLSFSFSRGKNLDLESLGNYPKVFQQKKSRIRIQMQIGLVRSFDLKYYIIFPSNDWIVNVLALQYLSLCALNISQPKRKRKIKERKITLILINIALTDAEHI